VKPPTVSELREIAVNHHGGADFHRYQAKHSRLTADEIDTERRLERSQKLIALACERWAEQIDAMPPRGLLDAFELLLKHASALDQSATHDGLENCNAIARARAALAKARA